MAEKRTSSGAVPDVGSAKAWMTGKPGSGMSMPNVDGLGGLGVAGLVDRAVLDRVLALGRDRDLRRERRGAARVGGAHPVTLGGAGLDAVLGVVDAGRRVRAWRPRSTLIVPAMPSHSPPAKRRVQAAVERPRAVGGERPRDGRAARVDDRADLDAVRAGRARGCRPAGSPTRRAGSDRRPGSST